MLGDAYRGGRRYGWGVRNGFQNRSAPSGKILSIQILWLGAILLILSFSTTVPNAWGENDFSEVATPARLATTPTASRSPAERAEDDHTRQRRLDFCTFEQCRPRTAQPGRDTLALAGLALFAICLARRPGRRRR